MANVVYCNKKLMGKPLSYDKKIKENVSSLKRLEKSQKEILFRDRVRFIRLLKSGVAKTQRAASEAIGISERQGQRNWSLYQKKGMKGLLQPLNKGGGQAKLEETQLEKLKEALLKKEVEFLQEAVSHVKEKYKKHYTVAGMHFVFKRLGIKKKTGRPSNIRQDKKELKAFKKNSCR